MTQSDLWHALKMCMSILLNALLLSLLSFVFGHLWGQSMPATITGRVVDSSGAAIPGSLVELKSSSSGFVTQINVSSDGSFRLENLTPGRYNLTTRAIGMADRTQTLMLTAGQALELQIQLHPPVVAQTVEVVERIGDLAVTATKTDSPLIETPQSISVITRERIVNQAPLTMQDALRYVAGVRAETYGFDNRGDWATIRGGGWGQYLNGLRMLFGSYNNIRPDPFTLERIDVIRGPSSVLYGQGGFGGVVNLTSKRPLPVQRREINVQFGNFGRKQVAVDLTGPIDNDGKWLYRMIALGRDSGTQVDYVPDDRLLFAPSLTWRPRRGTSLTVLTNFQQDLSGSSVGFFPWAGTLLPAPNGQIPTNTFISEPGFDEYRATQQSVGYLFEHRFNETWTIRQNMNYSHSTASYQSLYSNFGPRPTLNPDGRTINRTIYISKPRVESPTIDTHAQADVRTGWLQHTVLMGVDYQSATIRGQQFSGIAPAIDVYAPVYGNYTAPTPIPLAKSMQNQTGIYAQDQVKIGEKWVALAGIRKDWAHAETEGNAATKLDTGAVTGRAGLVYLTGNGLAPYFSYSRSFLPIAGFDFYNNPYKPQTAKQWETGVRFEPANGRGLASIALFDMTETNRRTPDPANPRNQIQVGEARIRGIEFETGAKIFWKLDLIATYTFTDARVTKSNSTDLGKRLPSTPRYMASTWATRRFRIAGLDGFTTGGGIRYTGSGFDGSDFLRTPSFTLYDAMFAYDTSAYRFSLNVANLTDKVHVATCIARGDCFYGMRRTIVAGISYRF